MVHPSDITPRLTEFTQAEGDPPEEGAPEVGQIYMDTVLNHGELVTVLHVGSTAAIIQRPNGVARHPIWDFRDGGRFRYMDDREET